MQFFESTMLAVFALLGTANATPASAPSTAPTGTHASCGPCLKPAFTAHITLGNPAGNITVAAGDRIVEPIAKGTVTGALINATVTGGVAYPIVEAKGTVQEVALVFYGATQDGVPFFVRETGIGSLTNQFTRLEIDITGKYQDLSTSFVLGEINRVSDSEVLVCGYVLQAKC